MTGWRGAAAQCVMVVLLLTISGIAVVIVTRVINGESDARIADAINRSAAVLFAMFITAPLALFVLALSACMTDSVKPPKTA